MTNTSTDLGAKAQSKINTEQADNGAPDVITLEQLAHEAGVSPRDARMLLRLAAKQTKQYPNLGKEHSARQPWQWAQGSKALAEAQKALAPQP
ncbi:hypothetical protein [uncultured Erythrobacter sp.]|uniref:hypothetical protein n=1 Tax=uncultured Erythrobacter sp. TaxID=263913 RepID=UPI00265845D7|nr:hypothetical protein [uncultured Erythrobacter sp.]